MPGGAPEKRDRDGSPTRGSNNDPPKFYSPSMAEISSLLTRVDPTNNPDFATRIHMCGKCSLGDKCPYHDAPSNICAHYAKHGHCKHSFAFYNKTYTGAKGCNRSHYMVNNKTWYSVNESWKPMSGLGLSYDDLKKLYEKQHKADRDAQEKGKEKGVLRGMRTALGDSVVTQLKGMQEEKKEAKKMGKDYDPVANADEVMRHGAQYLAVVEKLGENEGAPPQKKKHVMKFK